MAKKKTAVAVVCNETTGCAPVLDTLIDTVSAWSIADIDRMKEALHKREQTLSDERIQRDEELTEEANKAVTASTKKLVTEIKSRTKKLNALAQKFASKDLELKFSLPITLSVQVNDVATFDDMLASQDELDGIDNIVEYHVNVVVDDPDLSKAQLETISDVLADVRNTINDAASGACSAVFELFPKFAEAEKVVTKEYEAIAKLVSKVDEAICDSQHCCLSTHDLMGV